MHTLTAVPQYQGMPLGVRVQQMRVRESEHWEPDSEASGTEGMAAYMAWHWSDYLSGWRGSALRQVEEGSCAEVPRPSFANLTETQRMNPVHFFGHLALQLMVRHRDGDGAPVVGTAGRPGNSKHTLR